MSLKEEAALLREQYNYWSFKVVSRLWPNCFSTDIFQLAVATGCLLPEPGNRLFQYLWVRLLIPVLVVQSASCSRFLK